ncbi:acyl-CoA thioesterase [Granulosicoccus antarcticus]|uniref:1,4-dihydroxy-2-naphthoyl-CoA hydrolase n=1 Tax=Granulosicoccus antarcticus IMCC3135 TaxID=1192854 RepID=A0A2Z2NZ20_9GAMM|nr:1,4-dihydroxy-2-naphthoyl-CoA hydrolase [Granulosicoccus antarcticus IMCC3135]
MFQYNQKVLFKHCDPAGIVFYPRYFEMLNDTVEEFFDSELGQSFSQIHQTASIPTVQMNATFSAPSRLGDKLVINLEVCRIGRSSADLDFKTYCEEQLRFSANSTLVYVDTNGKPNSWPDSLRRALQTRLQGED